jgi:hypothetical protein
MSFFDPRYGTEREQSCDYADIDSQLNRAYNWFQARERQRQRQAQTYTNGLPDMTKETAIQACRDNGGYETPSLNEVLYLGFRSVRRGAGLPLAA